VAVTRETIRSFMGYCSSLPIDEFRSIEVVLDDLCAVVMPPLAKSLGVDTEKSSVGGVPGVWYRPSKGKPRGTVLYLHGGGYIGTSPRMYAFFVATLARRIDCEIFVSDYRLAPEFPFRLPSRMRRSSWKRSSTATQTRADSSSPGTLVVEVWSPR